MEKIQNWISLRRKELVFSAIIFIASTLSFGFGFTSAGGFKNTPIIIEECAAIHQAVGTVPASR